MWHRREKATIDHLVQTIRDKRNTGETSHSPFTSTGLSIEDQVRKAWRPNHLGLAMF